MTERLVLLFLSLANPQPADYDILIRQARIIDGAGNPWYRADIGIRAGKIVAIGTLPEAKAARTIDAAGRVVAPGFVDVHTHIETEGGGGIEKIPRGDNYLLDGVTTVVTGNCGTSHVRMGEWFAALEKTGLGLNIASLIGHNSVRSEVMGRENRSARPEEILKMQMLIEQAMRDGAVGFSTGLLYVPGTYANTDEVVALAKAAAKYGGIYTTHLRDQGEQLHESILEAAAVGERAGMPVQISHFKVNSRKQWGTSARAIELVEKLRSTMVDVAVDQYPYDRASTGLSITIPTWALAGGAEKLRERLHDPAIRARILQGMQELLDTNGFPDYSYATVASFPAEPGLEGKTISEINVLKGREKTVAREKETILELMEKDEPSMVYHTMSAQDVEIILRYPNTAIGSDGGIQELGAGVPHPRSYGTNARVLREFVRMRKVLTLEDAIRRMTSLPARRFGFTDRGLVYPGFAADLVIFDPERVQDRATFEAPHQYSQGFDDVLVNGVLMVDEGKLTEARPGKVLRKRN